MRLRFVKCSLGGVRDSSSTVENAALPKMGQFDVTINIDALLPVTVVLAYRGLINITTNHYQFPIAAAVSVARVEPSVL